MRILHYSLGLPPYRSGGLTKYCTDLMVEQAKSDNEVLLMFPGRMNFIKKENINIKFYRDYKKVEVYELINPLPVPILKGISKPEIFTKTCDRRVFEKFLKEMRIDIVHIHTFMGLYKEFLEVCKDLSIKIVFTSHDYFGLCNKVNFIDYNGEVCKDINFEKCSKCNLTGDSIKKIKILQSQPYMYMKNKGIIDRLKKYLRLNNNTNLHKENKVDTEKLNPVDEYVALSQYYHSMFKYIDEIFFNSEVAKSIYKRYIETDGITIPITHGGIKDNLKIKDYNQDKILKLTYLGPYKEYKGFKLLCDVMRTLESEGYNEIILNTYGDTNPSIETSKNMTINGRYIYSDLKTIFENTDMLIVPSICNETFGFITLEALSYGVPVLISNTVGAKDLIVQNKSGIVYYNQEELKNYLINIVENQKEVLNKINQYIVNNVDIKSMQNHAEEILSQYNDLCKD